MSARLWSPLVLAAFALGGCTSREEKTAIARIGNPRHGAEIIARSSCGACHRIPGIREAYGRVGPPLDGIASRAFIAGVLPNTPDNLVRWIENPPALAPNTAMPALGISEADAHDVAAFLYQLH